MHNVLKNVRKNRKMAANSVKFSSVYYQPLAVNSSENTRTLLNNGLNTSD